MYEAVVESESRVVSHDHGTKLMRSSIDSHLTVFFNDSLHVGSDPNFLSGTNNSAMLFVGLMGPTMPIAPAGMAAAASSIPLLAVWPTFSLLPFPAGPPRPRPSGDDCRWSFDKLNLACRSFLVAEAEDDL